METVWPHSLRARIALTITVALVGALVGIQGTLGLVYDRQVEEELRANLREQAAAVAVAVSRRGPSAAAESAAILERHHIVVRVRGGVAYSTLPVRRRDVNATATRGEVVRHAGARPAAQPAGGLGGAGAVRDRGGGDGVR